MNPTLAEATTALERVRAARAYTVETLELTRERLRLTRTMGNRAHLMEAAELAERDGRWAVQDFDRQLDEAWYERAYAQARWAATGGRAGEVTPQNIVGAEDWRTMRYVLWDVDHHRKLYAASDLAHIVYYSTYLPEDLRVEARAVKGGRAVPVTGLDRWWQTMPQRPDYDLLIAERLRWDNLLALGTARAMAYERDVLAAHVARARAAGY